MGDTRGGSSAADFIPERIDYPALRDAAERCMGCDLYKNATQAVFGEGDTSSGTVFVGEQPGDEEDLSGRPFVGPAGWLFDRALQDAGIDRASIYLTNAVKHFKWTPRGKRRIHEKPRVSEIAACAPWLAAEMELIKPRILVCLGATAAQSLLGRDFRVTKMRGQWLGTSFAPNVMATIHPSAILRTPDALRDEAYAEFVRDLAMVAERIT